MSSLQLFKQHGWRVQSYTTRQQMVGAYSLPLELVPDFRPRAGPFAGNALFIVATPTKRD